MSALSFLCLFLHRYVGHAWPSSSGRPTLLYDSGSHYQHLHADTPSECRQSRLGAAIAGMRPPICPHTANQRHLQPGVYRFAHNQQARLPTRLARSPLLCCDPMSSRAPHVMSQSAHRLAAVQQLAVGRRCSRLLGSGCSRPPLTRYWEGKTTPTNLARHRDTSACLRHSPCGQSKGR